MRRKALLTAVFGALLGCGGGLATPPSGSGAFTSSVGAGTQSCDCSGMTLPDMCMVCSEGMGGMGPKGGGMQMGGMGDTSMTDCAHFVCVQGRCEVQVCP